MLQTTSDCEFLHEIGELNGVISLAAGSENVVHIAFSDVCSCLLIVDSTVVKYGELIH